MNKTTKITSIVNNTCISWECKFYLECFWKIQASQKWVWGFTQLFSPRISDVFWVSEMTADLKIEE